MAKIKNKLAYILALVAPAFSMSLSAQADQPKTAGSDEAAKEGAKGSLSAGAIAAAVAAAKTLQSLLFSIVYGIS